MGHSNQSFGLKNEHFNFNTSNMSFLKSGKKDSQNIESIFMGLSQDHQNNFNVNMDIEHKDQLFNENFLPSYSKSDKIDSELYTQSQKMNKNDAIHQMHGHLCGRTSRRTKRRVI